MQLKNLDRLPAEVVPVLEEHVGILSDVLGNKLVGVYVHGSAALGGFTPQQSDIDYLAIVSEALSPDERSRLADRFISIFGKDAPAKGIEMSIVIEHFAGKDFRYPTPFEFHMGTKEQIAHYRQPLAHEETDPDLAAHFMIAQKRGACVYGKPINEIFDEVPKAAYLDSIVRDFDDSFASMTLDGESASIPHYAILNACRILSYIDEGAIHSKQEGGEWALQHLPTTFAPLVRGALAAYKNEEPAEHLDTHALREFAAYAQEQISDARSKYQLPS